MSKQNNIFSVRNLIQSGRKDLFSDLVIRHKRMSALSKTFAYCLSDEMKEHCRVISFKKGVLKVEADNNSWGAKLYYEKQNLLEKLRADPLFYGLVTIKHVVAPQAKFGLKPKKAKKQFRLSDGVKKTLASFCENKSASALQRRLKEFVKKYG